MEAIDPFQEILILQTTALTAPLITEITVLLLLLLCSALISGSEVAFFSLDHDDIRELSKKKTPGSAAVVRLLGKPAELISTIIITNTLVNISVVLLSAYIYEQLSVFSGRRAAGLLTEIAIIASMLILFGEVIPRVYAAKAKKRFSRLMALPLDLCRKIFKPLSTLLIRTGSFIKRRPGQKDHGLSKGELSHAISLASADNRDDEKILKGIVKFGNIEVKEIMRPRIDIMAVEMKSAFREVIREIIDSGYSRVPVYSDTFDSIQGVLYVKDILPYYHKQNTFKWQSLLRPPYFVPETKKINDLLEEFQKKKIHMAIVIDEYGSTSGIITLEDILEEIVGEIPDENDSEESAFEKVDDNIYIFEGKTPLNDFFKLMDIESDPFEEVRGDSDTLAGLILELTGEIPGAGYSIDYKRFRFSILEADKRRIKKLRVEIRKEADEKNKA